jgi:hypothetical protein
MQAKPPVAPAQVEKTPESAPPAPAAPKVRVQPIPLESWETASSRAVELRPQKLEEVAPAAVEEITPRARVVAPQVVVEEPAPVVLEPVELETDAPNAAAEMTSIPAAESIPDEAPHSIRDEKAYESAPRLNALRGLLFSIGLKNLGKMKESEQLQAESPFVLGQDINAERVPEPEPELIPEIERTVISRTFTPFSEPVPVAPPPVEVKAVRNAPREVTTLPEFLPPKESVPVRERETERESYDEFQTLPSRRGQYLKRRG